MTRCTAMVLDHHGGPEVLEQRTIEVPEPPPGFVRVRVRAVALNHLDVWVRRGIPGLKLEYPHRLGSDVAGEIESIGAGVRGFEVGTRVLLSPGVSCSACESCLSGRDNLCAQYRILGESTLGGYASLLNVPMQNLLPYPNKLSFAQAASVPLTFLTAWQMLVIRAQVRPGEVVLVQGAGSGVGVAAIQIARLFGARVWATAGTDEKCRRAIELGAEVAINYTTHDFVNEVRMRTNKSGVDVVIEHVGGETFTKSILATRRGGRVVTCGATSGFTPAVDLRQIFFRQILVLGSTMGPKGSMFEILRHVVSGALSPMVHTVLPLAQAREAHEILETRSAFGKVVLEHPDALE